MGSLFRIIQVMTAVAAVTSCSKAGLESAAVGTVNVCLNVPEDFATRSKLVVQEDESTIFEYCVVIYDLAHPERTGLHIDTKGRRTRTVLPAGRDYFAVAFANLGYNNFMELYTLDPDSDFYLFTQRLFPTYMSGGTLNSGCDGLVMVSTYGKRFHLNEGEDFDLVLTLERSVARIDLRMDKSSLEKADVTVTSVTLKNCSNSFIPIFTDDGPLVDLGGIHGYSGDEATEEQLESLNQGGTISLYSLENLQGYRQQGSYTEQYCTYVEICARHSLLGDIKYRCYPGNGEKGNFDLKRNCLYTVTICPTDTAGGVSCWRTEF